MTLVFMIASLNRLPLSTMKPAFSFKRLVDRQNDVGIVRARLGAILAHRLAVDGQRLLMDELALHQFVDDRRNAAGAMELLAQIFARRLHVDEQRHLVADPLPVLDRELDADVPGDGVDVDRRVGRAADGAVDDDRVLERLSGQDVGRLQILPAPFRRSAGQYDRRSARARDGARGSPRSRAGSCRAPRRAHSSSRRCPSCCNGRPRAPRR